ncbi:MAG: RICIN domain-containing protein [Streptosporangiaceae bacterium]
MSIKSKVIAAAATLTLVGGVSAVGTLSASAATPSCGHRCLDLFNREFGTHRSPAFVLDVLRQGAKVGQPIILYRTSNSDPAEDFTVSAQGTVGDFYKAGLVSAALNLHYSNFEAFEFEYAPNGADSNLCVGVGSTPVDGTKVALEPCGESAKTLWVVDSYDTVFGGYVPLINGADTNFSHPYVLNYPGGGAYPTDNPRPQLTTWTLSKYSNGAVYDNQLWGADFGVLK